jgi:GH15 family glucan-1,4-alpha-glucosidase
MLGTVDAIRDELMRDGLVLRYLSDQTDDGLPPGEGTFLACSFWMVDNLALAGDVEGATRLFERLLELRNDVGLLSEQWDHRLGRLVGNFPQALSHVGLINSAYNLDRARRRSRRGIRTASQPQR